MQQRLAMLGSRNRLSLWIRVQLRQLLTTLSAADDAKCLDTDNVAVARLVARLYRQQNKVRKGSIAAKLPSSVRTRNRQVDNLARRFIRAAKGYPRHNFGRSQESHPHERVPLEVLLAKKKKSLLLERLRAASGNEWRPISARLKSRLHRRLTLRNFSFLSNPTETMRSLSAISEAEAISLSASIDFSDEHCVDIGAWLVLAAMMPDVTRVFIGGAIRPQMTKVLTALRLADYMQIDVSAPSADDYSDIWAFPLSTRRAAGHTDSRQPFLDGQAVEEVGDKLSEAIDGWLKAAAEQQLSLEGRRRVKTIVGETLDNAQRHGRPEHPDDGDWMISGFMAKTTKDGIPSLRCQLAFFNVGSSLSATISGCAEVIAQRREQYVRTHRESLTGQIYAEQHLKTIFCLQDGVTCDQAAERDRRGGTGFGDIIAFFSDLAGIVSAESDARLAIVSGRTCLHIGWPYCKSPIDMLEGNRSIWFNERNDPAAPPDRNAVIELEHELPGTLVTMNFRLDRDYLEKSINGTD